MALCSMVVSQKWCFFLETDISSILDTFEPDSEKCMNQDIIQNDNSFEIYQ
jgi:hypothetical protein